MGWKAEQIHLMQWMASYSVSRLVGALMSNYIVKK